MVGTDVDADARKLLRDITSVVWPAADMLSAINAARREIGNLVPQAVTFTRDFACASGEINQTVPTDVTRLIQVVRNTGLDGTEKGRSIRLTTAGELMAWDRDWDRRDPSDTIQHYMYDPEQPREFQVWPAPDGELHLELVTTDMVPDLAGLAEAMILGDIYRNACVYHVIGTLLMTVDDDAFKPIAESWLARRNESLGIKTQMDSNRKPKEIK